MRTDVFIHYVQDSGEFSVSSLNSKIENIKQELKEEKDEYKKGMIKYRLGRMKEYLKWRQEGRIDDDGHTVKK